MGGKKGKIWILMLHHSQKLTRDKLRLEAIKLLEENVGEKALDICFDNNFLDMTPKA